MTKIKVSDVATMLGVTDQAIRVGLQRGVYPFGIAFKSNERNKKYCYVIYPKKLKEYVGNSRYKEVLGDI
ncbi:hypothetical protein [Peptostreptococcus porci]|uniref:hypothetical protein n=1 Tax=Peptostreptococcus porci TaxID=2652282 RepID=UPI002A81D210|nr:hypothetical protein [Peptostreptococcus porci]MDY4128674.1 hypothetical protein [Peptostreptococcus porci]